MKNTVSNSAQYNKINHYLSEHNCPYSAAEAHGIACGILSTNIKTTYNSWIEHLFHDSDTPTTQANLISLFEQVKREISSDDYLLNLLLPNNTSVANRVLAVQEWSQGYLYGITIGGLVDYSLLTKESKELLLDFNHIASSHDLSFAEDEQAEDDLFHIIEYLRMGCIILSNEIINHHNTSMSQSN